MANKKEKAHVGPTQKNLTHYKAICSQMSSSQTQKILKHLIRYGKITSIQAFNNFGCTRISARIFDLKQLGIGIDTQMVFKKKANGEHVHYGVYRLV